uniref:Uncharacterized protein n=1 Tax=Avena sativa TaxID=4498 RepID=A0ACD5YKP1_AVESA
MRGGGEEEGRHQMEPLLEKLSGSSYNSSEQRLVKRTGTVWTAMAHIITAVIGSGVLSLAWSVAQLGWVGGPAAIVLFAGVTAVQSSLFAGVTAVQSSLFAGVTAVQSSLTLRRLLHFSRHGRARRRRQEQVLRASREKSRLFCVFFLSINLFGNGVVNTLTSATSMRFLHRQRTKSSYGWITTMLPSASFVQILGLVEPTRSYGEDKHHLASDTKLEGFYPKERCDGENSIHMIYIRPVVISSMDTLFYS